MKLKYLRRVSRFPQRNESYVDHVAIDALVNTAPAGLEDVCRTARTAWHRPSGERALLEEGLKKYDVELPKRCFDGDYLAILKQTLDELRPRKRLIPLTLGAAEKHPDFPRTTSPGFPWVTQGFTTKGQVLDHDTGPIHRAWDEIGRGRPWSLPDAMAYQRVVASEVTKTKVRPVWGYPVDVVLEEARWFLPLISHVKKTSNERDSFYGLGMETALSGHAHLARCFTEAGVELAVSMDYSNFDARVPSWIIRDCFTLLSDWFDFSKVQDSEGKIWDVNPEKTARRWRAMVSYFVNTKIRTPSGLRVQKGSGVPSGSMWTNIIDTFVNAVQTRTAVYRLVGSLPFKDYYYGDDSILFLNVTSIDLDSLAEILLNVFGAILSTDKTILTDNINNLHWLGYFYRPDGPRRDLHFLVASSFFPEREVVLPIETCARLLGQLYSVMDPKLAVWFYDAVRRVMNRFSITETGLNEFVRQLPAKYFKYLATAGWKLSDIVLPRCLQDPMGGRYIPDVMPKPCARQYIRLRQHWLPQEAWPPERFANPHMMPEDYWNELEEREQHILLYDLDSDFDSSVFSLSLSDDD